MNRARTQAATSRELVWVLVVETQGQRISAGSVQLALVPEKYTPQEDDWRAPHQADPLLNGADGRARVALMVGPGGQITPGTGRFMLWARWDAGVERPADPVAPLHLT